MLEIKSLATRTLSGLIYVALIAFTLLLPVAWPFFLLYSFFAVVGIIEFNRLTQVNRIRIFRTTLDCVAAVWLLYAMWVWRDGSFGVAVFAPYFAYLIYIFARSIFDESPHLLRDSGNSLLSQIMIALPLALGVAITYRSEMGVFNGRPLLILYILIWINDTGAYLVGSTCGRHKLLPKVSPKKSVEGFVGGMLLSMIAASLIPLFTQGSMVWQEVALAVLLGAVVSASATIGDLLESVLKRNAGVKDSGNIIPGHGGILDRIDSLLLVVPVTMVLYLLIDYL